MLSFLSIFRQAEIQAVLVLVLSVLTLFLSAFSLLIPSFIWTWVSSSYLYVLLYFVGVLFLTRWFARGGSYSALQTSNLDGQTFLITGAGGGIGKEMAKELVKRGARVVLFARTRNLAQTISDVKEIARSPNQVVGYAIDLSDLQSIKACVDELMRKEDSNTPITALINNAGVMACPFAKTKDGFELQMGTNHFGHFYLTKLLLPRLHSSRIVNVSSFGHSMWQVPCDAKNYDLMCHPETYDRWRAYSLSKAANILFTRELQRRYSSSHQIRSYSLHPGVVATELDRHMGITNLIRMLGAPIIYILMKTPLEGAQTNLFCALSDQAKPGGYHADCQSVSVLNSYADNDQVARDWWDYSDKTINEKLGEIEHQ